MTSLDPDGPVCPSADQLSQFVHKQLAPQLAQSLVEHIARCPRCVEAIQSLKKATPSPLDVRAMVQGDTAVSFVESSAPKGDGDWKAGRQASLWTDGQSSNPAVARMPDPHDTAPPATQPFVHDSRVKPERPPAAPSVAPLQTGTRAFGDYEILGKLGAGGMGEVYKAKHRRMDRIVAMKILPGEALNSPGAVERFHREVQASAKLVHPNIVAAYDAGEQNGIHYLVMEYVEGSDLADVVEKQGPLPPAQAIDYVLQAARGLGHAHKKGVIHRDVKPANLILDAEGTIKVLDMGLAIFPGGAAAGDGAQRATRSGIIMGTPAYMAPEQAADIKRTDARADIYSLGCVLYYLTTGRDPYSGDSFISILLAHREHPVPSLITDVAGLSPAVDAIFVKMLAKRPEDRYQSMQEVVAALEGAANRRAESPPDPSTSLMDGFSLSLAPPSLGISAQGWSSSGLSAGLDFSKNGSAAHPPLEVRSSSGASLVPAVGQDFLDSLVSAGLLSTDELSDVLNAFPQGLPTRDDLLQELRRREWLSNYQSSVIVRQGAAELRLGQYVIWDKVAQSPRATQYTALHRVTRSLTSLKVFDSASAPVEDLRAAAHLSHPNIVPILELETSGERTLIASQYHHEGDYVSQVRNAGTLRPVDALAAVQSAARGLAAAAGGGMFHGNVGPWNLLRNESGEILVSDFGWASRHVYSLDLQSSGGRESTATSVPSPVDLAAPELLAGAMPDTLSDMYSLGATFFYLLSSRTPRLDKNLSKPQDSPPELSDHVVNRLPEGVQAVFAKLVAKDRGARFATWEEAIAALDDPAAFEAANRPVEKSVLEPVEQVPFLKRRGMAALAASSIAMILISLVLVGISFYEDEPVNFSSWGKTVVVALIVGLLWQIKGFLAELSGLMPFVTGLASGGLWAIFYYAMDLPGAELIAEIVHIIFGMATGYSIDRGFGIVTFGLLSGAFAGLIGTKGAAFMATGSYFPVLALAITISGYQLQDEADLSVFEEDEGTQMIARGEFANAINFYDGQIPKKPKKASLFYHRGRAHDGMKQVDLAVADFTRAITLAPGNPDGYARRGDTYRREKDFKRALEDYTTTLRLNPRFKGGKAKRGELYSQMGEHRQAIADLNDALVIDDKDIGAYLSRARAYAAIGQHDKARADRARAQLLLDEASDAIDTGVAPN